MDKPIVKSKRIRTEDGLVWKWMATICGDENLLKFRQAKQMAISSRFRWQCKLKGEKCDYKYELRLNYE
jgi:hypothetical protein